MSNRSGQVAMSPPSKMPAEVAWVDGGGIVFDAAKLTGAQRVGQACVACGRRWPRICVGRVPAGDRVLACRTCADAIAVGRFSLDVAALLDRAAGYAYLHAPDVASAVLVAMPMPYGEPSRRVVEAAAVAVARHIRETEDLVGEPKPPAEITGMAEAYEWLLAYGRTNPPAPVLRELLRAVARAQRGETR